jgi:hypothetical protein
LYFVIGAITLALGFCFWLVTSPGVASFILWAEGRYPRLIESKGMKASEIVLCGLQVLGCFALALWIALLMIE